MPKTRVARLARWGVLSAASILCLSPSQSRAAEGMPSKVHASYDVNFNGINVGTYEFNSSQDGQSYKLQSQASLSLLLGALHWTGATQASGKMTGDHAKPHSFGFDFQAQSKTGSTHMAFTEDTVTQVLHNPPPKAKEGIVPVQVQHLKGVVDPLTAVLAITRGRTGNPCTGRIPIYDGHQRFDLMLQPKGEMRVEESKPSGQPAMAFVCRVKYIPIAGHKPDDNTKFMAHNNDIEIVLRPLPSANIFVPHRVTIPTFAGSATLTVRRINVVTNNQQQIALVR